MKTKRSKLLLSSLLTPLLLIFTVGPAYAAGADLSCDPGAHYSLTATEGDSVSFSSSGGATSVSLSDGQTVAVPGSSGPLSAGNITFSDDCGGSGAIMVSAAATPPQVAG